MENIGLQEAISTAPINIFGAQEKLNSQRRKLLGKLATRLKVQVIVFTSRLRMEPTALQSLAPVNAVI